MSRTDGFTLIELLIVIAIIGILASLLLPALLASQQRSYDAGAQSCAKSIQSVQGLSQIDKHSYSTIGAAADQINRATDGVNGACKKAEIFVKDRSDAALLVSSYMIDVWDRRGKRMFTISSSAFKTDDPSATPFSSTGAGGVNLP